MSFRHLGWQDGPEALGRNQLRNIVECFNRIFFFGVVKVNILWQDLAAENSLGVYCGGKIELDPIACSRPKEHD
jgi:hypothetical protein